MKILTYNDAMNFLEIGKAYKINDSDTNLDGIILVLSIDPLTNSDGFSIDCGFNLTKFTFKREIYAKEKHDLGIFNTTYERYKDNHEQFLRDIGPITLCEEI